MKKPTKWVYILALMPGLGQMCLGLMNRGVQLMLLFWGAIFFTNIGLPGLMVFTPVLVFYAYFDALQSYRKKVEGEQIWDEPLIEWAVLIHGDYRWNGFKKKWIGWGLILLGILMFFKTIIEGLANHYGMDFLSIFPFEELILVVVLIFLGIKLLRGEKKSTVKSTRMADKNGDNTAQTEVIHTIEASEKSTDSKENNTESAVK